MAPFEVVRTERLKADPARVHALVDDFRSWREWSPWEGVDPHLERTYSGPARGVGSRYEWSGNRQAGAGSMEITESTPTLVRLDLDFLKPFKASHEIRFDILPVGDDQTEVAWVMTGEQKGLWALVGRIYPMDKMVGKDFEKGLTQLKQAAEA